MANSNHSDGVALHWIEEADGFADSQFFFAILVAVDGDGGGRGWNDVHRHSGQNQGKDAESSCHVFLLTSYD
jgi:hypothetical protein